MMRSTSTRIDTAAAPIAIEREVPLGPMTTLGVGGPAEMLARPSSASELVEIIEWAVASSVPWYVLGTGANIVVGDGGMRGLVIRNVADRIHVDGSCMVAESGAIVRDMITVAEQHALSGIEHFTGIPSTLGGAMWQNLHFLSPDRTRTMYLEEVVHSSRVLFPGEGVRQVGVEHFAFGYDESVLQHTDQIVIDVTLQLTPTDQQQIRKVMWSNAAWRAEKHPPMAHECSVGSIFRKIEGEGAGRLIDRAGLKGYRIGGMMVSPIHANFIVNTGGGTAAQLRELVAHIQQVVEADCGLRLHTEVTFVGDA